MVVLPNVILDEYTADQSKENLAPMINHFEQTGASQIMVESVSMSDVSKSGVVDCNGVELKVGEPCTMTRMVEKAAVEDAPQTLQLRVVTLYLITFGINLR